MNFSKMKKTEWANTAKVEVITDIGEYAVFDNINQAKLTYPELDILTNGSKFTWAMRGQIEGKMALRFESWKAYDILSE